LPAAWIPVQEIVRVIRHLKFFRIIYLLSNRQLSHARAHSSKTGISSKYLNPAGLGKQSLSRKL
jgi:hypothetical protein